MLSNVAAHNELKDHHDFSNYLVEMEMMSMNMSMHNHFLGGEPASLPRLRGTSRRALRRVGSAPPRRPLRSPARRSALAQRHVATVLAGASHDALRIGLQQKISEMESMESRLSVQLKELIKELAALDAARRQMERAASKQGVREVTVRCIELHAKLQKKFAKQRRDGGGGTFLTEADAAAAAEGASGMAGLLSLLEGEQRDQERRAAVMASSGEKVQRTIALLQGYKRDVEADLENKRQAVRIEKECLLMGRLVDGGGSALGSAASPSAAAALDSPTSSTTSSSTRPRTAARTRGGDGRGGRLGADDGYGGSGEFARAMGRQRPASAGGSRAASRTTLKDMASMETSVVGEREHTRFKERSDKEHHDGSHPKDGAAAEHSAFKERLDSVPSLNAEEVSILEAMRERLASGGLLTAGELDTFKKLVEKANAAAEDDDDDDEAPATPPAAASPSTPPPRGSPNGSDGGAALERWRGATQRLIDEAFTAHTKARQWRLEMSRETEAAEGAGRAAFAHVTREIKRHVQAAAQQAASMYTRQLSFDGRLNQLRADRRALERAKIARAAPLKAAKQTMQKRAQRPAAEQVAPRRPRVEQRERRPVLSHFSPRSPPRPAPAGRRRDRRDARAPVRGAPRLAGGARAAAAGHRRRDGRRPAAGGGARRRGGRQGRGACPRTGDPPGATGLARAARRDPAGAIAVGRAGVCLFTIVSYS